MTAYIFVITHCKVGDNKTFFFFQNLVFIFHRLVIGMGRKVLKD